MNRLQRRLVRDGRLVIVMVLTASAWAPAAAVAEDANAAAARLPLLRLADLAYAGAFRLPSKRYGRSSLNYAQGPIALGPRGKSLFIVGHAHHQAVAQFAIPRLVASKELDELEMAGEPIQPFAPVLGRAAGGNPQGNNRIGGMLCVAGPDGPELLINAYEYYDAPGDNTLSLLVVRDANDLAGSTVDGYFAVRGGPGHTAGWMSPVPAPWRAVLGGAYLMGHSGGIPIISRSSVGPSAFLFDPRDVVGRSAPPGPVATRRLLDFSLKHPLHKDLLNRSGKNDLWTHLSRAVYGIIVPGTRTYATFGSSGGNASGVGYKIVQDTGRKTGGYSSYAAADNYHYYWLWDASDLAAVRAGRLAAHEVRPYEHGRFHTPFEGPSHELGGGAFDPAGGLIYLTALGADDGQGRYQNPPVVMAYRFAGQQSTQPARSTDQ